MDIRELRDSIPYPTSWVYRVIGRTEEDLRAAVMSVIGTKKHDLRMGNHSRNDRWLSMELVLEVESEEERLGTFHALMQEPRIKYVL